MLIIRLLRFLRGYICFSASEGFPERFLNLCNQAGAAVWDISWRKDVMLGKTDRRGFALMQACAAPAGVKLEAGRRVGLPFFLHTYRLRFGLLLGLCVCVLSLSLLSGMVWTIEVHGNERVAEEEILRVMEAQGLRLGTRRNHLDAREMSRAALPQLPGVGWISLNLRGSSAMVEVREELPLAPRETDTPQDIEAAKAGQLVVMELYGGSAAAGPGQAVLPGDLLAGGVIRNADDSVRLVHAMAYAVARTHIACGACVPRAAEVRRVAVETTRYSICFLWFKIPLWPAPKGAAAAWEDTFAWITSGGKAMPLALARATYVHEEPQTRVKNDSQLRMAAAEAFFDREYQALRAAQVIRQEVSVALGEDRCEIALEGAAYENVGVAREIQR